MKICLIANPESILIKRWVEFYKSQNHEVHIIKVTRYIDILKKKSDHGVSIHPVFFLTYLFLDLQFLFVYIQILRMLKKIKPDILHAHYLSYHAWLGATTNYHPFIVSAWGGDIYIEAKNLKKNQKWVKYALEKADFITTTSKVFEKIIIKQYNVNPKRITSFYWGQDLDIFKEGYENNVNQLMQKYNLDKNTFVVLSSRNMDNFHGIQYIIDCIPYVIKKRKQVKFIFLRGSGPVEFENQMKKKAKDLKIDKFTVFIQKYLNSKELAVINNLADIVISLPISDQFSGAVKEGMACGAIPIVHNLDVYREKIEEGKNGFLVNREDPNEVAKRIIYCIDNHPKLKKEFAIINRKILEEKSDWNKNSKLMLDIYQRIIKKY